MMGKPTSAGTIETRYWALILTRNGEGTIRSTAESIMSQTIPPSNIFIVDDGSTDKTPIILTELRQKYPEKLGFLNLPDQGYDIRRVVNNINVGIRMQKKKEIKSAYFMISGDDCSYTPDYARRLLERMDRDHRIVIASGEVQGVLVPDVTPRGSGRFIRTSFLEEIGDYFPPHYGYEGWILQKALQLGYSIRNYPDIRYRHLRELGTEHRFRDWGLAMRCLGYHPLEVLYRCVKYPLIDRRVSVGYLRVLWDYFVQPSTVKGDPYYRFFEEDLRGYIQEKQKRRNISRISGFFATK
jgi:glycosyltransferase involved in cell wall biosynthesis